MKNIRGGKTVQFTQRENCSRKINQFNYNACQPHITVQGRLPALPFQLSFLNGFIDSGTHELNGLPWVVMFDQRGTGDDHIGTNLQDQE